MDALFSALGLGTRAERLYVSMVHDGPISRREPHDEKAVKELEAAGLVQIDHAGLLHACPPRAATEVWAVERELEVMQVRKAAEALADSYENQRSALGQRVEWIVGREESIEMFETLESKARREIRGFDRGPYMKFSPSMEPTQAEAHARGVAVRVVYEAEALQDRAKLGNVRECVAAGEQARVFSGVPLKLFISDDELAMISLPASSSTESMALLVYPSPLLDALVDVFEAFWRMSISFDPVGDRSSTGFELTEETRRLLHLLAAGLSDKAIARDLGVSERTLHRRLTMIQERLGVRTRFQIGAQAALHGWI